MNAAKRAEIFRRLQAANPAPTTELEYSTPFQLLIAVILSAQATDKSVNLATRKLFADAPTPQAIFALGEDRLSDYINRIGLYRTKSKNVIATCRQLIDAHGGEVPREREALEALPGVGRKTANVVLNTAFGEPTIAVDTHIFRVANRIRLAPGKTPAVRDDGAYILTGGLGGIGLVVARWLVEHGAARIVLNSRSAPSPAPPSPWKAAASSRMPAAPSSFRVCKAARWPAWLPTRAAAMPA